MIGDSITSALIQKALDGTWQRQKTISNNIANHETPGYKAVRVNFEQELKTKSSVWPLPILSPADQNFPKE